MQFSTLSSVLLRALSRINGVLVSNPIMPILEDFLFEIKADKLIVTGSDLQTSITTTLSIEGGGEVAIAIPARILIDTLKNLPDQVIQLCVDSATYTVTLVAQSGSYKLAGENAADFPVVEGMDVGAGGMTFMASAKLFKRGLEQTLFATSNDDLIPALKGVLMDFSPERALFVATDAHKLVKYELLGIHAPSSGVMVVQKRALSLLGTLLDGDPERFLTLSLQGSRIYFQVEETVLTTRVIEEKYPNYENAIPKNNTYRLVVERKMLLHSLKRLAIYANKTSLQVRVQLTGNQMKVSTEDKVFSNEANELLVVQYSGPDLTIGFNVKYFIEMLSHTAAEQLLILLDTPSRGVLIFDTEKQKEEELLLLLMPVLLEV